METVLVVAGVVAACLLALAGVLHLLPRLGPAGRRVSEWCTRAPLLDLLIVAFQIAPLVGGLAYGGWRGLAGAVVGMLAAYFVWVWLHELAHREAVRGPRIVRTMNRIAGRGVMGRVRNHAAVWATALALPIFWFIRAAEVFVYPLLVLFVDFPRYRTSEWVNVSRQKFSGLVGHDLIWCLYCDWMTGVYALGGEMLRNVESFWCPIRFYSGKKCANCAVDFPDVENGWVAHDGTMGEVVEKLEEMYGDGRREWFGHPARLTVDGRPPMGFQPPRAPRREAQPTGEGEAS